MQTKVLFLFIFPFSMCLFFRKECCTVDVEREGVETISQLGEMNTARKRERESSREDDNYYEREERKDKKI
jgi:hypothetical protein